MDTLCQIIKYLILLLFLDFVRVDLVGKSTRDAMELSRCRLRPGEREMTKSHSPLGPHQIITVRLDEIVEQDAFTAQLLAADQYETDVTVAPIRKNHARIG